MVGRELEWLRDLVHSRVRNFFEDHDDFDPPEPPKGPSLACVVLGAHASTRDRTIAALAVAPHLLPDALDPLLFRNSATNTVFTEFGALAGGARGVIPSVETALFLTSHGLTQRLDLLRRLTGPLVASGLVAAPKDPSAPPSSVTLEPGRRLLDAIGLGSPDRAPFAITPVTTELSFDDLVLPPAARAGVEQVRAWIEAEAALRSHFRLASRVAPGVRALFHGPSGTGKTLAATLIGQATALPVWRVDLSMVVSKWVGETEKNLSRLFDACENQAAILLFDEADALFGRRSISKSAHDRYANQEVSYLLQRLETSALTAILTTNLKANIDDAFARRFQVAVYFPPPGLEERRKLFARALAPPVPVDASVNIDVLAKAADLSGAAIVNTVARAAVRCHALKQASLDQASLSEALTEELRMGGRLG